MKRLRFHWAFLLVAAVMPAVAPRFAELLRPIFIMAILALGLNILTGFTGILNLGVAAFMGIGAYTYAILTCDIYPFQLGFWGATGATIFIGLLAGLALGLPTIRLRGDYLAIVTLGFGEIVQDSLKNMDVITKGTQGINPLPAPPFSPYYLFLAALALVVLLNRNLQRSRIGRAWIAIREDELAASCVGINPMKTKLLAFALGAAQCALAGGLWASSLASSGEPGNYDFQVSIIALCIVIVGGMGNIAGVLLGAVVVMGFNTVVLETFTNFLKAHQLISSSNVFTAPGNWKYLLFGLALILMMRFRPEGLLPSKQTKAELHPGAKSEIQNRVGEKRARNPKPETNPNG